MLANFKDLHPTEVYKWYKGEGLEHSCPLFGKSFLLPNWTFINYWLYIYIYTHKIHPGSSSRYVKILPFGRFFFGWNGTHFTLGKPRYIYIYFFFWQRSQMWKHPKTNMTSWNIHHLKMYFLLNMGIFQCHVSFQGSNPKQIAPTAPRWFCTHQNLQDPPGRSCCEFGHELFFLVQFSGTFFGSGLEGVKWLVGLEMRTPVDD